MATSRRRLDAHAIRHAATMPDAVQWWLANGRVAKGGDREAWQTYALQYDHTLAPKSRMWSRADVRAAGCGAHIDALIARGACPPDRWRH
jgi:hypothetical protein